MKYQENHIIGLSNDKQTKAAKIALAIMTAPIIDVPTFVCRIIRVYSVKHDLTLEQTQNFIDLIHQNEGFTFLLM